MRFSGCCSTSELSWCMMEPYEVRSIYKIRFWLLVEACEAIVVLVVVLNNMFWTA